MYNECLLPDNVLKLVFAEGEVVYKQAVFGNAITSPTPHSRFLSHAGYYKFAAFCKLNRVDKAPGRQSTKLLQNFANLAICYLPQPNDPITSTRSLAAHALLFCPSKDQVNQQEQHMT